MQCKLLVSSDAPTIAPRAITKTITNQPFGLQQKKNAATGSFLVAAFWFGGVVPVDQQLLSGGSGILLVEGLSQVFEVGIESNEARHSLEERFPACIIGQAIK